MGLASEGLDLFTLSSWRGHGPVYILNLAVSYFVHVLAYVGKAFLSGMVA